MMSSELVRTRVARRACREHGRSPSGCAPGGLHRNRTFWHESMEGAPWRDPAQSMAAVILTGAKRQFPADRSGRKLRRTAAGRSCIRLNDSRAGGHPSNPITLTAPNGRRVLTVSRSVVAPTTSSAASTPSGGSWRTSPAITPVSTTTLSAPTSRRRPAFACERVVAMTFRPSALA